MAFILAVTEIACGVVLPAIGKSIAGIGAITAPIAALVSAFMPNKIGTARRRRISDEAIDRIVAKLTESE
jgi:hypothetical protein